MQHKNWEEIKWSPEQQQKMYRDWGVRYSFKHQFENASYYYDKALELKEDDITALYFRSRCYDDIAETMHSIEDALKAYGIDDMNCPANLQVCDAYYYANMFETCKTELFSKMQKFTGWKRHEFQKRIDVVDQNCNDALGDFAGMFLTKHQKLLPLILEIWHRVEDTRPLWKILKEQNKCDVVSILEEKTKEKHPREIAKADLYFKVFNQIYFGKGWFDVIFMKDLIINKTLLLPQTKKSTPILEDLIKLNYQRVMKFLKMLHARNPIYINRFEMCPDQKLAAKTRESHLNRVQYQTRRDMFNILKKIKTLRKQGNLKKLVKIVENVMGDYTTIKTLRVMPRKYEFTNEVYNVVVLSYIDKLKIPANIEDYPDDQKLEIIMKLPIEKDEEHVKRFIFGNRSTCKAAATEGTENTAYVNLVERLEQRLKFVEYPIENCYLYYSLSRRHLDYKKFDTALAVAKKVVEEGQKCNNYGWIFLGAFQTVRIHTAQKDQVLQRDNLRRLRDIVPRLKSNRIKQFVDRCYQISLENKINQF